MLVFYIEYKFWNIQNLTFQIIPWRTSDITFIFQGMAACVVHFSKTTGQSRLPSILIGDKE